MRHCLATLACPMLIPLAGFIFSSTGYDAGYLSCFKGRLHSSFTIYFPDPLGSSTRSGYAAGTPLLASSNLHKFLLHICHSLLLPHLPLRLLQMPLPLLPLPLPLPPLLPSPPLLLLALTVACCCLMLLTPACTWSVMIYAAGACSCLLHLLLAGQSIARAGTDKYDDPMSPEG